MNILTETLFATIAIVSSHISAGPEMHIAVKSNDDPVVWLAKNIYFESKNQSTEGQIAVAMVTMRRVESDLFPNTIKKVVTQNNKPGTRKCQFSWFCDGKSDKPRDAKKWAKALLISHLIKHHYNKIDDITNGADHYHATYVRPAWSKKSWMSKVAKIGAHIFYKRDAK